MEENVSGVYGYTAREKKSKYMINIVVNQERRKMMYLLKK